MKIIIDSNIAISALISPKGTTADVLFNQLKDTQKLTCYFLYIEIFDKKNKILKASKLPEEELIDLLYLFVKRVEFINESQIPLEIWRQAEALTKDIDLKDIAFIALTIHTKGKLWTGDKPLYNGLKSKGFDDVVNTKELLDILTKNN